MENGIKKLNDVIEYIEKNIREEITCSELAKIAVLSEYEFRRIFSFLVGIPLGEYIRKRRLSLAAEELKSGKYNVSEIATRYGYDAFSSFTRAFREMFGVSPSEAKQEKVKLELLTKPRFTLSVQAGMVMSYTEEELPEFTIKGICGESQLSDTCCCESVWQKYEKTQQKIESADNIIYAAYVNGERNVLCYIGMKTSTKDTEEGCLQIDGGKWLCFDLSVSASEKEINDFYERIIFSFLPSSIYEKDDNRPNVEVFGQDEYFIIMIPVRVK